MTDHTISVCRGKDHVGIVVALLTVLLLITPLAHARPPDSVWIHGIYDAADFDEIVVAVANADGLLQPIVPYPDNDSTDFARIVEPGIRTRSRTLSGVHARAPPIER